jgi:mono/diheme cytochrome c family protein
LSRVVRRAILTALSCSAGVAVVAGCGSVGVVQPAPQTVVGTLPKAAPVPVVPADKLTGNPTAGKAIFLKSGCVGCHTLADAHATGTVGPNLDTAKPDAKLVAARVTLGKPPLPSFKGQLTDQQIADVAAYVVKATGGTP